MNQYDFIELSPQETEGLLYAIDGALKVDRRSQFYLWAQGGLQSLIPHETMVCAWGDIDGLRFRYEVFTRLILDDGFEKSLADPIDGLLPGLIDAWRRAGKRPHACVLADGGDLLGPRLRNDLQRHGVRNVVLHGAHETGAGTGSFFAFLNGRQTFGPREGYLTELVLPHLHMAVHRLKDDKAGAAPPAEIAIDCVLSAREAQVLQWVREGKTNLEIAQILDLSPLTVKNHVQRILRKLKVTNRAQAVAKGIASRLIAERHSA